MEEKLELNIHIKVRVANFQEMISVNAEGKTIFNKYFIFLNYF